MTAITTYEAVNVALVPCVAESVVAEIDSIDQVEDLGGLKGRVEKIIHTRNELYRLFILGAVQVVAAIFLTIFTKTFANVVLPCLALITAGLMLHDSIKLYYLTKYFMNVMNLPYVQVDVSGIEQRV